MLNVVKILSNKYIQDRREGAHLLFIACACWVLGGGDIVRVCERVFQRIPQAFPILHIYVVSPLNENRVQELFMLF